MMNLRGFQSVIVLKDNKTIFKYGDITYSKDYIASCRKSVMAILYGMYKINLDKTLEELNITDVQGLSDDERRATVRNLLESKSAVYHPDLFYRSNRSFSEGFERRETLPILVFCQRF